MTRSEQPQTQPGMTMEKNAQAVEKGPKQKWKHSAFACEDSELCCYMHFNPCMAYSDERSRLKHLELNQKRPERQFGVDSIIWCAGFWFCLYWVPQMMTRARVRQRYNIEGSLCGDFWLTVCCPCPAIMQELEQIEEEEKGLVRGHGDGELRVL